MSLGIAELIVMSNEASQTIVNLKQKHAQAKATLKQVRDQVAAVEATYAAAVAAANALPDGQVKVEAVTKATALTAERQALQAAIEADLTALNIRF